MRGRIGSLALLAISVGAPSSNAWGARWPSWAEILPREALDRTDPAADAVVVNDQWDLSLRKGARTGTRRRVVQILTEKGREYGGQVLYRNPFSQFSRVKVWTRCPDGRVKSFNDEDGTLFSISDPKLLDDDERLWLSPPGLAPGCAVALEYRFEDTADLPQDVFQMQGEIPTLSYEVRLEVSGGWTAHAAVASGANPGPVEVTEEGAWKFSDIPAARRGKGFLAPVPRRMALSLSYSPPGNSPVFHDWASMASWAGALYVPDPGPKPFVDATAERVKATGGDALETAGRFVRRLRYFGLEVGWGAFRPRPPETTLRRAFGDCKDKAFLLVEILRRLGIEAFPVLAMAPTDGYVADEMPTPFAFNHVIVAVPWTTRERRPGSCVIEAIDHGPLRFYDPTLAQDAGQDVSVELRGGACLVLSPKTTSLVRIPEAPASENLIETDFDSKLTPDGSLEGKVSRRFHGAFQELLERSEDEGENEKEVRKIAYQQTAASHPRLADFTFLGVRKPADHPWSYEYEFRDLEPTARFGDLEVLSLPPMQSVRVLGLLDGDATAGLHYGIPFTEQETYRIALGERPLVDAPDPVEVRNSVGRVSLGVRREGETLHVERALTISIRELPQTMFSDAKALRQALRRINDIAVVLSKKESGASPGKARQRKRCSRNRAFSMAVARRHGRASRGVDEPDWDLTRCTPVPRSTIADPSRRIRRPR
jgi:hypothetical protein